MGNLLSESRAIILTDGKIINREIVMFRGKKWFVTGWTKFHSKPIAVPRRIVCIDSLSHAKTTRDNKLLIFVIIPKEVFDMSISPKSISGFDIIDKPDIEVTMGTA